MAGVIQVILAIMHIYTVTWPHVHASVGIEYISLMAVMNHWTGELDCDLIIYYVIIKYIILTCRLSNRSIQ